MEQKPVAFSHKGLRTLFLVVTMILVFLFIVAFIIAAVIDALF